MTMLKSKAHCLCGAVKISATEINPKLTVCHCASCRLWGGGPYFALRCGTGVTIEGEENITSYDSSSWASRGFCKNCGTHLFYKLKKTGEYNLSAGLFPELKELKMDMQYFSDQRPEYYCFSNDTKHLTRAEIMAYFATQV
jgi:hypothetical protein